MSKTSGDNKRGVVVGFGALAIAIVAAAAYYGGMAGSENAAGTVMQAKRYKADSTTGPTPTPTTADTKQAGRPAGVADASALYNSANSNNSAMPNQGAVVVAGNQATGNSQGLAAQGAVVVSGNQATGNSQSAQFGTFQGSNSQGSNSQGSNSQGSNSQGSNSQGSNMRSNSQGSNSQGSNSQGFTQLGNGTGNAHK